MQSVPPLQRVLYAEDEPDIRAIAEISLADIGGFQTCMCDGGREALTRAAAFRPDLILLDVMMPEMDGVETLRQLREDPTLQQIPVCFLTAKSFASDIQELKDKGAAAVINKPFDPMTLPDQLQEIWKQLHG